MASEIQGELLVDKQRFAVLVSRFNDFVTQKLHQATLETLRRHGCLEANMTSIWVPGALELPLAARAVARSESYDGIVALGCVIRGATPHFEYVSSQTVRGLSEVSLQYGIPVAMGVLTTDNIEQAMERSGKTGNKGAEAALVAVEMVNLLRRIVQRENRPGRSECSSESIL